MTAGTGGPPAGSPAQASLLAPVASYYSQKIREHGATPLGVDWSCEPTQKMRFVQLLKLCDFSEGFSLNDVGCGYGALLSHLSQRHPRHPVDYLGTDLSREMIAAAARRWSRRRSARFEVGRDTLRLADYSIASGIFNVKLDAADDEWERAIGQSLLRMRADSRKGLAINFIREPGPAQSKVPQLYYAQPQRWTSHCEKHLDVDAEIVEGYGMREFTLLMRCRG